MRRKVTKAAALLSAVLMASSSVPYGVLIPYNVLAEEVSADAGAAVQEETATTVGSVTNIKTWDAAGLLAAATTEDSGLSLKGDGWSAATDSSATATEAYGTGDYVKAGGTKPTPNNGAVPTAGCYLQYTATDSGKLTIMEKTQAKVKTFYVVDSDGNIVTSASSGEKSTYDTLTFNVEEGKTYYAYMSGSTANIFQVSLAVGEKKQTAWADVATPVINSVTTDEAGDFVVDFSAVIDAYKGADDVKVTMLQDGLEVSTQTFTKQADTATFAPYRSGTYTFVVVAQRTGEADKASEVYTYKDYVLAVKKPVITWAQNKGNGDVYLDWINIEDADSYSVAYKESGSTADYTVVESALSAETGNYTLTGLTAGKSYDIQIKALRKSDGFESVYTEKDFEVTTAEEQPWYAAIVGSAQAGDVTFTTADGQTDNVKLSVSDNSAAKSNNQESPAIAGTAGTLEVKGQASGKISDDEDGFTYYYTKIDPTAFMP